MCAPSLGCLLLFQLTGLSGASTYSSNFTDASTRLRSDVFGGGYDPLVAPKSNRSTMSSTNSTAGTDVDLEIRVFKITKVELTPDSTLEMLAWVRQSWHDERLAWDPEEYGGLTRTYYAAQNMPTLGNNEIWTPDFTVYNAKNGLAASFEAAMAQVEYTGRVYWSRPGILSAFCKFSGIVNFPFDDLKCKVEIGGWMLSGAYQGLSSVSATLDGTGDGAGESTSKPSYADYNLTSVRAHINEYEYPADPQNPYPVMMVELQLKRVNDITWFWIVVMPMAALTYLAMFAAFIPIESGERLGYGITMLVAIELNKMVLVGVVPIAGEILQLEILTFFSALFCYLALLQSFVITFLYNHTEKHLLPTWMTELRDWCAGLCCSKQAGSVKLEKKKTSEWDVLKSNRVDDGEMDEWDESGAAILYRAFKQYTLRSKQEMPTSAELDDLWDLHFETKAPKKPTTAKRKNTSRFLTRMNTRTLDTHSPPPSPPTQDDHRWAPTAAKEAEAQPTERQTADVMRKRLSAIGFDVDTDRGQPADLEQPSHNVIRIPPKRVVLEDPPTDALSSPAKNGRKLVEPGETLDDQSIKRLMLFEKLFFDLDTNVNGSVDQEDLTRLLSYLALDWPTKERKEFAATGVVDDDGDNMVSRAEFLEVCLEKLWDYDLEILEMAITNFNTAQALVKEAPSRHWRRVVHELDKVSRFWLPVMYTVILVIVYNITLHDGYDDDFAMWKGIDYFRVTMTRQQVITILVAPLIVLGVLCFYFTVKNEALKRMKVKMDGQLESAQEQVQLSIERSQSSFEFGSKEEAAAKLRRKSIQRKLDAKKNQIVAKSVVKNKVMKALDAAKAMRPQSPTSKRPSSPSFPAMVSVSSKERM